MEKAPNLAGISGWVALLIKTSFNSGKRLQTKSTTFGRRLRQGAQLSL